MRKGFLIILLIFPMLANSQLRLPLEEFYHQEVYRITQNSTSFNHLSSKPILLSNEASEQIYADTSKQYYWITQKLFKENFLIFKGDGYWCSVDPIIDLEMGHDLAIDSFHYKFWNTRGIRVQASFIDKLSFVTTFYETQATLPDYQKSFFSSKGEFTLNGGLSTYNQKNAIVPGYARTKNFKTSGYDFAFAQGYLTFKPSKNFMFDFGNGNHFIGDGHRSLLLSDQTTNYTFLKPEFNFWNNRIQYQIIYALLTNPYRLKYYDTPEATYERKIGTIHYLDIAITKNLMLGFFQGSTWRHTDSTGTHKPNPLFLNPLIGTNNFLVAKSEQNFNTIHGVNLSFRFKNLLNYGQLLFDNNQLSGYQIGILAQDLLIKKLDVRAEYNSTKTNSYLTSNKRYNYTHNNLSLGHVLGGGIQEIIVQINYQWKRFYLQNHTVYYAQYQNDSLNLGTNVILPMSSIVPEYYTRKKVGYNQFEIGYRFNKRYNLQMYAGYLYRQEEENHQINKTSFVYFGMRTRLKNKRFDY